MLDCLARQVEIVMMGAFFIGAGGVSKAINTNYRGVGDDSLAAVRQGDNNFTQNLINNMQVVATAAMIAPVLPVQCSVEVVSISPNS
jgi:hypothetical protein